MSKDSWRPGRDIPCPDLAAQELPVEPGQKRPLEVLQQRVDIGTTLAFLAAGLTVVWWVYKTGSRIRR